MLRHIIQVAGPLLHRLRDQIPWYACAIPVRGWYSSLTQRTDLFWSFTESAWNTIFKIIFIASSAYTLYLMLNDYKPTHDPNVDTFKVHYLLGGAAVLAILFPYKYTPSEILWAFSIWPRERPPSCLSSFLLQRTGEAETITTHYLFCAWHFTGLCNIPNWNLQIFLRHSFVLGSNRRCLQESYRQCCTRTFFWVYYTKVSVS